MNSQNKKDKEKTKCNRATCRKLKKKTADSGGCALISGENQFLFNRSHKPEESIFSGHVIAIINLYLIRD